MALKPEEMDRIDKQFKKLKKKLPEKFIEEVNVLKTEDLDKLIVTLSKSIEEVNEDEATDPKLNSLKEDVKLLSSGYKDQKNAHSDRLKWILLTLKARGVV
jgi:CHAD domain-containing protein